MAASLTPQKEHILEGNIVKDVLPLHNGKSTKIVLKIYSKYTQIGKENKIFGLDVIPSSSRSNKNDDAIVKRLELNNQIGTGAIFIQGRYIQIQNISVNNELEIIVESVEGSSVQIGDRCELRLRDEQRNDTRKTEVNSKDHSLSVCGRDVFVSHEGTKIDTKQNQFKRRQRKPQNRKRISVTKTKAKETTKTAPVDSPECLKLYDQFFKVQKILHPLRDDGKWSLYDESWNELIKKYGEEPIWDILLRLEYGIRICYNSQFELPYLDEAEKIIYQERRKIERLGDSSIKQFCTARLNCYLASVYRRKKLYGRAEICMNYAQNIFQSTDDQSFLYDKAIFYYEKASLLHEFGESCANNEQAKKCLEICTELCRQLKTQDGRDFVNKGQFAQFKKVMLLLAGSTKKGRKRCISGEDLEEAKKCLDDLDMENNTEDERPISEQLERLLAKCDCCFRMQDLRQAREFALQAIDLADKHGFNSSPGRSRLEDIQELQASRQSSHMEARKKLKSPYSKDLDETFPLRVSCDADGSGSQSTENSDVGL